MRNHRETMRVIYLYMVCIIAFSMAVQFRPTLAQLGCWERISNCLGNSTTASNCCPKLLQEITNERECFCSSKPTLEGNATLASAISGFLTLCDVTRSFDSLCPGSVPSPTGNLTPPPPGSTLSPSEAPIATPPGSNLTPSEAPSPPSSGLTPSASPTTPDTACFERISTKCEFNSTTTPSSTQLLNCCDAFKQEIDNERDCFCGITKVIGENETLTNSITQVFTVCNIPGTLATICPSSPSTPDLSPPSLGTPSSSRPFLFPPPPPEANITNISNSNGTINGSKKIGYSALLIPISFLIWEIIIS